jgi:DNA-binding GntR family transcriptional regulator
MLADTLGVSATPVREALSSLAGDGILHLFPGGVVIVPVITRAQLEQWLWLRRVIECRLVERGLERKTPADAEAIADLASSVARNQLDPALCVEIAAAVVDRIVTLADLPVMENNLRRVRVRCAATLADGQRHAGAEASISFATAIARALLAGNDSDARISHCHYLDSTDAAAHSIMDAAETTSGLADSTIWSTR